MTDQDKLIQLITEIYEFGYFAGQQPDSVPMGEVYKGRLSIPSIKNSMYMQETTDKFNELVGQK